MPSWLALGKLYLFTSTSLCAWVYQLSVGASRIVAKSACYLHRIHPIVHLSESSSAALTWRISIKFVRSFMKICRENLSLKSCVWSAIFIVAVDVNSPQNHCFEELNVFILLQWLVAREDMVAFPLQQWLGGSVTTSRDRHGTFLVTSEISTTYFGFEQPS